MLSVFGRHLCLAFWAQPPEVICIAGGLPASLRNAARFTTLLGEVIHAALWVTNPQHCVTVCAQKSSSTRSALLGNVIGNELPLHGALSLTHAAALVLVSLVPLALVTLVSLALDCQRTASGRSRAGAAVGAAAGPRAHFAPTASHARHEHRNTISQSVDNMLPASDFQSSVQRAAAQNMTSLFA